MDRFFFYIANRIWKEITVRKAVRTLILIFNIVAVAALLFSYLSVSIPPDKYWVPSFFGLAYPVLAGMNILFIIFWVLVKPRYLFISLISILIGWGFLARYVQLKGKTTNEAGVKLISFNVQHFSGAEDSNPKDNADKIISFLNEQKADIICLQETRLRKNSIFNLQNAVKELNSIEHYQFARSSTTFGSVTLTRFPIVNMGEIRFEKSRNMTIYTDVIIDGDTIRIFNLHLQSYLIDPSKYSIIDSPGIDEENNLKEVREMGSKFKTAFQLRAEMVREIKKYIDGSPYPVIVCGDFNDTPVSYAYQKLRKGLKDAFICSGQGIGQTYIGRLPSFRIDNIFHSEEFESFNFETFNVRMSDHLPVSCKLIKK